MIAQLNVYFASSNNKKLLMITTFNFSGKLQPDLNGNPFFLALGKALAKKDWEWKAD